MQRTYATPLAVAFAGLMAAASVARAEDASTQDLVVSGQVMSLADALTAAEQASELIDAARYDVDRARSFVDTAKSGYFPQVNTVLSYTRTLKSQFDGISFGPPAMEGETEVEDTELPFGQPNTWRAGFTFVQPLFDGFRTRESVRQARAGVRSAELGVTATRAQLVLEVSQAYFNAQLAERQVQIAEVTLQQADTTLKETELNFQHGAAPEFDLVRAQVARDNQANTLVQFRAQRDVAFVRLRRLVGLPLGEPLKLTTTLDADDVDEVIAAAKVAAGIPADTGRVAVRQAREAVNASEAAVGVAKADRLPALTATSDLAFIDYANHPFNSDWRTDWTVGVNLSFPIFDGWRRRAAVRSSSAELHAAQARLAAAGKVAQVEVAQASSNVESSTTLLEASARTVKQAERAYQIAELRFTQGASSHLEITDARVQLEQALLNQARAARDLRVARLQQELLPGLPLGAATGGF